MQVLYNVFVLKLLDFEVSFWWPFNNNLVNVSDSDRLYRPTDVRNMVSMVAILPIKRKLNFRSGAEVGRNGRSLFARRRHALSSSFKYFPSQIDCRRINRFLDQSLVLCCRCSAAPEEARNETALKSSAIRTCRFVCLAKRLCLYLCMDPCVLVCLVESVNAPRLSKSACVHVRACMCLRVCVCVRVCACV